MIILQVYLRMDPRRYAARKCCVVAGRSVVGDHRGIVKPRELKATVAVRCAHHGDLDTLLTKSGNATRPLSLHHGLPFELQAEGAKELNRRREILDDDADVVHPLHRHAR